MEKRKSGLILWVTYPGERMASLLWVTYPGKKMENGLILMGDLPRKYDLIVMGDLPRKRKCGLILWVTYPGEGMASFL